MDGTSLRIDQDTELRRLNWALAAYARSAKALIHFASLQDLTANVCAAIVGDDVYAAAAVARPLNEPGRPVRIVAAAGRAAAYLEGITISWDADQPGGDGPAGRAIRSGQALFMRDGRTEPMFAPWRERAARFGLRSTVTVPFKRGGQVAGVFMVYASTPDAFGPDEVRLFEDLGDELAFAMTISEERARLRASEEAARASQAELARIGRALAVGEMAASIAHEISQPLAAIVANAHATLRWLDKASPDIDRARRAAERTLRDAGRASDVVARVRSMLAKDRDEVRPLDVNAVVAETLRFARPELRGAEVELQTRYGPALPKARADRTQLQQVILNLVLNAAESLRAAPQGRRRLTVTTERSGDDLQVCVADNGAGFPAEDAPRLFDPFFTTRRGGIGLGLSISRSIVEAHGGRIWAEPTEGGGATFRFTLPIAGSEG